MEKKIRMSMCLSIFFSIIICKTFGQVDSFYMDEVIISANKTEERINRVAQQVSIINAQKINLLQSQNTADLLFQQGIFVQKSQQGGGSPVLRGFEASRILLVIDGVRMNNAIYRSGHLQNVLSIDNNSVERVEVLYGPSSTVYGSDAFGGVISFTTKKAKFKDQSIKFFSGLLASRYGTVNNESTHHFDFNIAGKNIAALTSISFSKFGDLKMGKKINRSLGRSFGERPFYQTNINGIDTIVENSNKFLQLASGYGQTDIIQKISHKINEKFTQHLNIQYSTTTDIPRYDRLTDTNDIAKFLNAEWYYGPQKRLMVGYHLDSDPSNPSSGLHFGLHYQAIEESRFTRLLGNNLLQARIENLNTVSGNFDFRKKYEVHDVRYGADFQFNLLSSIANNIHISTKAKTPLDTRYPDGDNYFHNAGIYVTHSLDINERFIINDGLRLGYSALYSEFINKSFFPFPYNKAEQNNITYSAQLGLNYLIGKRSKVALNLSSGFRSPNIDDLAKVFDSTPLTLVVPNPSLRPEKTYNIDLSGNIRFSQRLKVQAILFSTAIRDAIITDTFLFDGRSTLFYNGQQAKIFANQNKRSANLQGVTFGIEADILEGLKFESQGTLTKGIINDRSKKPLDHIPPFIMRSSLGYVKHKLSTSIYVLYNGWKRIKDYSPNGEDNQQYAPPEGMPSWWTLNMKSSYQLNNNVSLMFGIENLFDLQYRVFASGINAPGRNVSISGKLIF